MAGPFYLMLRPRRDQSAKKCVYFALQILAAKRGGGGALQLGWKRPRAALLK